jgi:hypothetical protein
MHNRFLLIIFLVCSLLLVKITDLSAQNAVQTIINDMTLSPDAPLHGTEGLSWGTGEASPQPMQCPAKNFKGEWFEAMTNWGQVYIPRSGSLAVNTRCQIRNVISKILDNNGAWTQVQSGNPAGAAFVENFANNASIDAGIRDESANGGGISVIVGIGPWTGYNFHFWSASGRATVDVNNISAVYTTCEARLIQDDPDKPDDRTICKNVFQMGGDWWLNLVIGWLPDWSANSGIGVGRAKWVTSDWQSFNMCTLTPAQIIVNPPIEFDGISEEGEKQSSTFAVYPNPLRNGNLIIKSEKILCPLNVKIYSTIGKVVFYSETNRDNPVVVTRSVFIRGLYLIKVSNQDVSDTKLLVVE